MSLEGDILNFAKEIFEVRGLVSDEGACDGQLTHWVCTTCEENWNVVRSRKIWGVPRRNRRKMLSLKVGDCLVFYVKQRKKKSKVIRGPSIGGIFEVSSEPFFQEEEIFHIRKKNEAYPWRVRIEALAIPRKLVEFREAIPRLSFIRNKRRWGDYMQVVMRLIPKKDFECLKSMVMRT